MQLMSGRQLSCPCFLIRRWKSSQSSALDAERLEQMKLADSVCLCMFQGSRQLLLTGFRFCRFNPNLYESGKVCLSLLGTWQGKSLYELSMSIEVDEVVEDGAIIFNNKPGSCIFGWHCLFIRTYKSGGCEHCTETCSAETAARYLLDLEIPPAPASTCFPYQPAALIPNKGWFVRNFHYLMRLSKA